MKSRLRAVLVAALAAALVAPAPAFALPSNPSVATGQVVLADLVLVDGVPTLGAQVDGRAVDPAELVVQVDGDTARSAIPPHLAVLGAPGSETFLVPAGDTGELPVLTFASTVGELVDEAAVLVDVAGPGDVVAYTEELGEPLELVVDSTRDELSEVSLARGHVTPTWSFTQPGLYELVMTPRVTVGGEVVWGDASAVLVEIGAPTPQAAAPEATVPEEPAAPGGASTVSPDGPPAVPSPSAALQAVEPCFNTEVPSGTQTVSDGHFDFGVQVQDGALVSAIKDDTAATPTWVSPESRIFRLDDSSASAVPSNPAFSFLGQTGDPIWQIPQNQKTGVPWLGWNTQHSSAVTGINGATTWRIESVDGPGELFIYQVGSFGDIIRVLSLADGWPTSVQIPPNVHAHGNWSFTEPGVYRVTTVHEATLIGGQSVSSRGTLTFHVGPCLEAPDRPTANLATERLLADAELTEANRGGVSVSDSTVVAGDEIAVTAPTAAEGHWHMPVFYSEPQQTTWVAASAAGVLSGVTVPALAPGAHKVAVYSADGGLVGWAPITVSAPPAGGTPPPAGTATPPPAAGDTPPAAGDGAGATRAGGSSSPRKVCVDRSRSGGAGSPDATGESGGPAELVSDGHFDFGAHVVDGQLVPLIKDDRNQPPVWVSPTLRTFVLGATGEMTVPDNPDFSFLGAAGSTVWMIPQTQISGVPWLGWNTQHETMRQNVEGPVTFTLDGVDGPGELAVYLNDSFGGVGEKKFGTMAGFPSSFTVPLNVHAHGNWVFTEPGSYGVRITQTATLTSGATVSASATINLVVGGDSGASPSSASAGLGGTSVQPALAVRLLPTADKPDKADKAASPSGSGACLPGTGVDDVMPFVLTGVLLLMLGLVVTAASASRPRPRTV